MSLSECVLCVRHYVLCVSMSVCALCVCASLCVVTVCVWCVIHLYTCVCCTYIATTAINARCPVQMSNTHRLGETSVPANTVRATLKQLAVIIIHVIDG